MKQFTIRIQSRINKIRHSPDPVQSKSSPCSSLQSTTIASHQSTISHQAQYNVMSDYICKLWVVEVGDVVLLCIFCCIVYFSVHQYQLVSIYLSVTLYIGMLFPLFFVVVFMLPLLSFERVSLSTASPPRYPGRCWAAIRLSHRPEPSDRVVRGEVDGFDSGGRHDRRFVPRHTHRPQRRPYPISTGRSGNVQHRCGGCWAGPRLFLGGSFRVCVYRCLELKCGVLWGRPPTLLSIDDPPTALHVCGCCQKNWWVDVRRVQMGASIWGAVQLHPMDGWVLNGAGVQAPWHGVLEIVWLLCVEPQQVGYLWGLEGCPLV